MLVGHASAFQRSIVIPGKPSKLAPSPIATRTSRGFSRQDRWEQLVAAAAEEFMRSGYQSASMEDIASRVDMRKASLYHYVASKEDLLYELELRAHAESLKIIEETRLLGDDNPAAVLRDFISRWIEVSTRRGKKTYVRIGPQDLQHLSRARQTEIHAMRDLVLHHVTTLIARGQQDGSFTPDTDPKIVASALLSLLNSPSARPRVAGRWRDIAKACTTFFLHGLTVQNESGLTRETAFDRPG
jgi:TetR/AcrR family transcriptional regulator, cholesterol catabolism regulator